MFRKITMEIYGKPMGKYPRRSPNFENLRHHVLLEETFVLNSFLWKSYSEVFWEISAEIYEKLRGKYPRRSQNFEKSQV